MRRPSRSTLSDTLCHSPTLFGSLLLSTRIIGALPMLLRFAASAALVAVSAVAIPAQAADPVLQDTSVIPAPAASVPLAPEPLQAAVQAAWRDYPRSEEHTSELQSLMRNPYAVFCLKKKKNYQANT